MRKIFEEDLAWLERMRLSHEADMPVARMYGERHIVSFSSELLYSLLESLVQLMCLDPENGAIFAHFAEWTSVILMQRGMNG